MASEIFVFSYTQRIQYPTPGVDAPYLPLTNFWTATPVDQRAYERLFNVRRPTVGRDLGNKPCGFSVRCVRRP